MFKLSGSLDRYLFVDTIWVIKSSLDADKALIRSGKSGQICPAHPSNFFTQKPDLDLNTWADEIQDEKFEEGVVLLRCSVHDADHAQWLVEQAREAKMEKENVGAFLCEEDNKGTFLLSLLDKDVQKEVSPWNRNRTNKIAHLLSSDCVQWIVQQALEGNWDKEDVVGIVCRKNRDHTLVLATLDFETQKQVAMLNQEKTTEVAHLLSSEFHHWLVQQTLEGKWSKEDVVSVVCRKTRDNQLVLATLDEETQHQVAVLNQEKTIEVAHLMSSHFVQWLIQQANKGVWFKEYVDSIVWKMNGSRQLVFERRLMGKLSLLQRERKVKLL